MHFEAIRRHRLVRRYREKCFIFCSSAFVIPFLPGIYASLEKRWQSRRTCPGFHVTELQNEFARFSPPTPDLPYLFSFIGSTATARCAGGSLLWSMPADFFHDTAADFDRALHGQMSRTEHCEYARRFVAVSHASKFVLCPRGLGIATIRLMEAMRMGRAPVVISDGWGEPTGPSWERFSIRVEENDIAKIPRLLERREAEAVAMAEMARQQWEQWFSETFHRVVGWCLHTRRAHQPEALGRFRAYPQLFRPIHIRRVLRPWYHALRHILHS